MHKIAYATPASAVATSGTITFSYPTDTTAGDFAAYGHKLWSEGLQAYFNQDDGLLSVSFGASDITVTYKGTTSLPANKRVTCEFNIAGTSDKPADLPRVNRTTYVPIIRMDLGAPDTADDNGIVESQNLTAAGVYSVLAFNGVYGDPYNNTKAVLDVPRNVVAAWTTNAVLTVTGKDEYGDVIVEKSAGGSASFTGKKAFKEITSIATDTNITSLTVGTGDVLGLPVYVDSATRILQEIESGLVRGALSGKIRLDWNAEQVSVLAGTTAAIELVAPCAGVITGMTVVTRVAVGTGGAVTAAIGTTAIDGLSVTVADSSTKGTTTSDTPTAGHATTVVAKGDRIQIIFADAFATTGALDGFIEIQPTGLMSGTFVAGVQTTPTATTGDVRGTYDPEAACNGTLTFSLIAAVPDPAYRGVDNYDG